MTYKRQAGQSTRQMASQRRKSAIWIFIFGVVVLTLVTLFSQDAKTLGITGTGGFVLLVLVLIFRSFIERQIDSKLKLEKRAIRGAKAEEKVGKFLDELPTEEFYVLNDVASPYGNIDHIVIGKNCGVFLLETKAHGGKVEIDGDTLLVNGKLPEKNFISQALQNSYWLRDRIGEIIGTKPWITPVIVFTNAFVSSTRPVKGVYIVNKKYLLPLMRQATRPSAVLGQIWQAREKIDHELS